MFSSIVLLLSLYVAFAFGLNFLLRSNPSVCSTERQDSQTALPISFDTLYLLRNPIIH